jgi:hypothetical protein
MDTQNITLALPKDVLVRARRLAVERRTSLSALVSKVIVDLVEHDDGYKAARDRQIAMLQQGLDLGTGGTAAWTREELHER